MYDYSGIPPEMKELGKFCLYRIETKSRDAPKKDKIPYRKDGRRADSGNLLDYLSFDEALEAYKQGNFDGIGIGCFKPFILVDVDHCVEDGKLDERGNDIVDTLSTYTELSPSGTGIHCFVLADTLAYNKQKYYINNRNTHVEVYVPNETHRFLTLTGRKLCGDLSADKSKELQIILDKYMSRQTHKVDIIKSKQVGSFLSDESVYTKASLSKQGTKFDALWNGEIPDGKSHSEADMALAEILAFWCGGDIEQMDRLFRSSGLMRDKWDRKQSGSTYGLITLAKAVANCNSFYSPIASKATDDFNDVFTKLSSLDPLGNSRYRSGDIGYGRLFADMFKDIARYVPERKKWFVYDGKCWKADIANLEVMELGKDLADSLLIYASTIQDEERRKLFLEQSKKWQQRRFRETYIKEAQSIYPIPMDDFDKNMYLFNCNNLTINLNTGKAYEHRPEDYLTKVSSVIYDPNAYSLRFEKFIEEIMSSDKDKAIYLQKSLGYGICGDTRYECMFLLYGESTRNGKGTLMESVLKVLGDYGKSVRPETIAQKHNVNSQSPSEDIARLAGIRFANIAEPSRGLVLNAAQVKNMTGNDTLNARFLNENSFDFKPQFKLYINTNYLPVISDMTMFSSGRIIIIPFDRHFETWEQDRSLKQEFAKSESQSAILNWLIKGYQLLKEEGFKQPQAVMEAITSYKHESDKLAQFADECLLEDKAVETRTSLIYERYRSWCLTNGCYCENNRNFLHELRKFGKVDRKRPQQGGEKTTVLIGYKLLEENLFP